MKILAAFGQGNGYGDGKVYVCLENEFSLGLEKRITATFERKDITRGAINAFKYSGYIERDSLTDMTDCLSVWTEPLTIYYSNNLKNSI